MCKSVKGAAYFGSSIHVVAAFIFLVWFLFDTVITEVHINLWRCLSSDDDPPRKYNVLVHYLNLPFKFLYFMSMCITGIYIFRGVERNSPRVIKFALLVFVIVQIIALALFITISLSYWAVDDAETLPTASRLLNPNLPTNSDQIYESVNSYEDSDENGKYSIKLEVFSNPPEVHHSQDVGILQKPVFEPIQIENEDVSKNSGSGPENLIIRAGIETNANSNSTETEAILSSISPEFEIIPQTGKDSSFGTPDIVRILKEDGREFLMTFPSVPQSMLLEPEATLATSDDSESRQVVENDDEVKAVLESPLDVDTATTTPMPMVIPENEVVLVKVIKEGNAQARRLSHGQLVSLVFQIFLVGFNVVGSFIYTAVLIAHLTTL